MGFKDVPMSRERRDNADRRHDRKPSGKDKQKDRQKPGLVTSASGSKPNGKSQLPSSQGSSPSWRTMPRLVSGDMEVDDQCERASMAAVSPSSISSVSSMSTGSRGSGGSSSELGREDGEGECEGDESDGEANGDGEREQRFVDSPRDDSFGKASKAAVRSHPYRRL